VENEPNPSFHIQLLNFEKSLLEKTQNFEKINQLNKKVLIQIQNLNYDIDYKKIWMEIANCYKTHRIISYKQNVPILKFSEKRLEDLFNKPVNKQASFKIKEAYYLSKLLYFSMYDNTVECLKQYEQLIEFCLTNKGTPMKVDSVSIIQRAFYSMVYLNLIMGQVEQAKEVLTRMESLEHPKIDPTLLKDNQFLSSNLFLLYTKNYKNIIKLEHKILEFHNSYIGLANKYWTYLSAQNLYFGISIAFFKEKAYTRCIDWIVRATEVFEIMRNKVKSRSTIVVILQMTAFFCHYELGHYRMLPSLFQSLQYSLSLCIEDQYLSDKNEVIKIAKAIMKKKNFTLDLNQLTQSGDLNYNFAFLEYFEEKQKQFSNLT